MGARADGRVFGFWVDDDARGADIDLYVQAGGTRAELLQRELKRRVRLARRLGKRRIDVIVQSPDTPAREIDRVVLETGIRL